MWCNAAGQKMAVSDCTADIRLIVYFERNAHLAYDHPHATHPQPGNSPDLVG